MAATKSAEIAFILPLYNKFAYGRRAALSFFKYTERPGVVIAVDDASPHFGQQNWDSWYDGLSEAECTKRGIERQVIPRDRTVFKHFDTNKGLTRGWNWGLQQAKELGCKYTIAGNSDILFTPGWEHGLIHQVEHGYALVGPVTNAPGVTNKGRQRVDHFYPGYNLDATPGYLKTVADYLRKTYSKDVVHGGVPVNGFFMLAKTDRWWQGAFDKDHVFDPKNAMVKNEDELQRRWHKRKWLTGFVPSSFVFHYRAVSRGDKFKVRGWHRIDHDLNQPV